MQHDRADLTEYADSASVIEEARSEGSDVINLVTVAAFLQQTKSKRRGGLRSL
jgi:hypothetical protein